VRRPTREETRCQPAATSVRDAAVALAPDKLATKMVDEPQLSGPNWYVFALVVA
jgi:hypothetical protein